MPPPSSNGPPPLPPRPAEQTSNYSNMAPYNNTNMYGHSGYGMYNGGMYNGANQMYGGGSYNNNMYGGYTPAVRDSTTTLTQQAGEQTRQAFRSVETFVQAFGSVSMMLESTFYAFHNSVRAVVSVGEQVGRARAHISQLVSALAIIRTLRALYHRLCVWLGLRAPRIDERLWSDQVTSDPSRSSWPVFAFFGIILGGPWLVWKILASFSQNKEGSQWADGTDEHFEGVAEFEFQSQQSDELSFKLGQRMRIAPKQLQPRVRGWLLASVDEQKEGYVPANRVKVLGKRAGSRQLRASTEQDEEGTRSLGVCSGEANKLVDGLSGEDVAQTMASVDESTDNVTDQTNRESA